MSESIPLPPNPSELFKEFDDFVKKNAEFYTQRIHGIGDSLVIQNQQHLKFIELDSVLFDSKVVQLRKASKEGKSIMSKIVEDCKDQNAFALLFVHKSGYATGLRITLTYESKKE